MSLSKVQRFKIDLEAKGELFPTSVDSGHFGRVGVVMKVRLVIKIAQDFLKRKNFAAAMEECRTAIFLMSLQRVRDPLIQVCRVAEIVALVVQVLKFLSIFSIVIAKTFRPRLSSTLRPAKRQP